MNENNELTQDILKNHWAIYERLINHHSALLRIFSSLDEERNIFNEIPRIFVEETEFDTCMCVYDDEKNKLKHFFSIYKDASDIDPLEIKRLHNNSLFPSLHEKVSGYQLLYIYPMVSNFKIEGFIVLGKTTDSVHDISLKYVEVLCMCCARLFNMNKIHLSEEKTVGRLPAFFLKNDSFPYPLIVVENTGKVVWMNDKAKKILPENKYSYKGMHIEHLFSRIELEHLIKDKARKENFQLKCGNNKVIFEVEQFPIHDNDGNNTLRGIILKDITEQKLAEEENLFREKMETLGMLSAGIAHDFNNMLTGILGYSSLLKNFLNHDERLLKYVEVIERSAERASSLTKQLLNFARKQERPSHEFDIRIVIEDSLLLLCESLKNISVERDLQATKCIIRGDESEFQHIFLNLFMNAKEAMEGHGTIKVSSKNVIIGNTEHILISVEDTGKGIDEKVKENLFKPYYTTKKSDLNMGLGLFRVERTVKKYGGFIEIDSEKGKGTKFSIYIPINRETRSARPGIVFPEINEGEKIKKKKRVLVVDDEEFIGEMFSIVLNKIGLDVVYCPRGDEALKYIENKMFDCIILDIIMPGMKGDEILKEIRKMNLSIPVIVSSGYMSEEQRDKVKSLGVDLFLDKPFNEKKIISMMQKIIED